MDTVAKLVPFDPIHADHQLDTSDELLFELRQAGKLWRHWARVHIVVCGELTTQLILIFQYRLVTGLTGLPLHRRHRSNSNSRRASVLESADCPTTSSLSR